MLYLLVGMKNIQITCDRCGKLVEGLFDVCKDTGAITTGGYYIVSEGNWRKFQRWEEENVCDECMHSDPKYKKLYGIV